MQESKSAQKNALQPSISAAQHNDNETGVSIQAPNYQVNSAAQDSNPVQMKRPNGLSGIWDKISDGFNQVSETVSSWLGMSKEKSSAEKIDADKKISKEETKEIAKAIQGSVGKGGINQESDVKLIQGLLVQAGFLAAQTNNGNSNIDGKCGKRTIQAINDLQRSRLNWKNPDGVIEPGGQSWDALSGGKVAQEEKMEEPIKKEETIKKEESVTPMHTEEKTPIKEEKKEEALTPIAIESEISASVGKGAVNSKEDVTLVQRILKFNWGYGVSVTGIIDDKTIQAIRKFQHRFAGMISSQDSRIDAGGTSWKYLSGALKPAMGKTDDGLMGGAETDDEKKMAEFTEAYMNIQVNVGNGETVSIRPPYHINLGKRKTNASAARANAPKVYAMIKGLGFGGSVGKATPAQIKSFLEQAIAQGLVTNKSSLGLYNFLATYGVSMDCSGLAIQAANFLIEGDMDRADDGKGETIGIMATSGIQNQPKVASPATLQAGDMMVNYKRKGTSTYHVRVITDVDTHGDGIQFSTLESGSSSNLGDGGNGVGQVRWEFPDASAFSDLKKLEGNTWKTAGKSDKAYTYVRFKEMDEKKEKK